MERAAETPRIHSVPPARTELKGVLAGVDRWLEQTLNSADEQLLDPLWSAASAQVREYALRPGKRLRPALVVLGHSLVRPGVPTPDSVWRFAAGLELLHTFLLIHDDVADRADRRRGGPALHHVLGGGGRLGEDLAVVAGDHLFARSLEVMLSSGAPNAAEAVAGFLQVCRHTAVGQYLDLQLSQAPLSEVTLFQTLKVAHLKTARYGFVAPLVCGAKLGGADAELLETLERIGRHVGLAFQLRDDLLGLFGDPEVSGKSAESDVEQGKRTFPVVAAHLRADDAGRAALESAFAPSARRDLETVSHVRSLVERFGGARATERAIDRSTRAALRALDQLPDAPPTSSLRALIGKLARRAA